MNLIASQNLFIDTSVFVKENFLEGSRIKNILELSQQGYFNLYFSPITINEIKARYKKLVKIACAKHNEFVNDKAGTLRILKNHSKSSEILQRFPSEKEICQQFNDKFDKSLQEARAHLLTYPTLAIEPLFTDYFNNAPPFDKPDKKHEFPDVFALAHIEQWIATADEEVIIFSTDKDFASKKRYGIKIIQDYNKYLADLMMKIDPKRIEILSKLLEFNSEKIKNQIIEAVKEDLNREDTYDELTNRLAVHNIDIKYVKFDGFGFEIVSLRTDKIEVEYFLYIAYKVVLEIDDEESAIYDAYERRFIYDNVNKVTVKENDLRYNSLLSFKINNEDEYSEDYEILRYNNGKSIKVSEENYS